MDSYLTENHSLSMPRGCIGVEEVSVYRMQLCGFVYFLFIGQIDTVKATYKTLNKEQDVTEATIQTLTFKMLSFLFLLVCI